MEELVVSVIQKVKDVLNIKEELSSEDLYDRLHDYRSTLHPDKFLSEDQKKVAEEKFKNLSLLLKELHNHIEFEILNKKPSELIPYKKEIELINTKQIAVNYEEKIQGLEKNIDQKDAEIKRLKKELKSIRSNKVDEKTQELIKHYQPSKGNLVKLGVAFALTLAIGVISRIDQIAKYLAKYSPVPAEFLNTAIFIIIVLIPFLFLKSYFEKQRVEFLAKKIRTPKFIQDFSYSVTSDSFTELDVYNFLFRKLVPRNPMIRFLYSKIFILYSEPTIDSLKDIFISNLYNKQFIYISSTKMLDRMFKIHNYSSIFQSDDDEELGF